MQIEAHSTLEQQIRKWSISSQQSSICEVHPSSPGAVLCLACGLFYQKLKIAAHRRSCIKRCFRQHSSDNGPISMVIQKVPNGEQKHDKSSANHANREKKPSSSNVTTICKFCNDVLLPEDFGNHMQFCPHNSVPGKNRDYDIYDKVNAVVWDNIDSFDSSSHHIETVSNAAMTAGSVAKVTRRKVPSLTKSGVNGKPRSSSVIVQEDTRKSCHICNRKFNEDALERHTPACEKLNNRNATVFDSAKARAHGTALDLFTKLKKHDEPGKSQVYRSSNNRKNFPTNDHDEKVISTRSAEAGEKSKAKWRVKHEQFIQNIRSARGDPRSFVASEPDPDHVSCPYCERRFQQQSAERHIPFCKQSYELQRFKKPSGKVQAAKSKANDSLMRRISFRPPPPPTKIMKPPTKITKRK